MTQKLIRKALTIPLLAFAAIAFLLAASGLYPIAVFADIMLFNKAGILTALWSFVAAAAIHGGALTLGIECLALRRNLR